jgi:hypothetical protein
VYIGKTPTVGNFQVCDAISVVNGQAAYTLQVGGVNVAPESANHMLVSLNGILQKPGSSFTISGSTMTFASNLATGDVIDFVQILGNVLDIGQPSDDTVTAAKLNNDIISGQTALTSAPDLTDELLISDAGTLKRIDYSLIGGLVKLSSQTADDDAAVTFDSTIITSSFKNYILIADEVIPATDAAEPYISFSTDNGSSYANDCNSTRTYMNLESASTGVERNTGNFIQLGTDIGNDANRGGSYIVEMPNLTSTNYKWGTYRTSSKHNTNSYVWTGGFSVNITGVINNFKFYFSTGNINKANITLYGVVT